MRGLLVFGLAVGLAACGGDDAPVAESAEVDNAAPTDVVETQAPEPEYTIDQVGRIGREQQVMEAPVTTEAASDQPEDPASVIQATPAGDES
ncbi:MAG: hypothetical protein AAFV47_02085 [Pseudomonadota bacterium]